MPDESMPAATAEDLGTYVGANAPSDPFVARCWSEASDLVTRHIGDATVPQSAIDRAMLEVGSELFYRRQAPHGVAQFTGLDGAPVRVARDPMVGAIPILAPYLPPEMA